MFKTEKEFPMEMTLGEAFSRSARKFPQKIACMDDHGSSTYALLNRRVNRWANALKGLGLQKGHHAATLSNNCIPLMEVYLGNLKQGVVTVPLDARGTLEDNCFQIESTDCSTLIFHASLSERAEELRFRLPHLERLISMGGKPPGFAEDYEDLLNRSTETDPAAELVEEDEAFILFTGGTTGMPKGAILTHKNLLWNSICVTAENHSPAPDEKIYYTMQMYHSAALSRFLAFMYAGGTFIGSSRFDPERYLDVVEKERTTFIVGNTTIFRMLLEANRRRTRNTSSIKRWLCAQGFLHPNMKEEIENFLFPGAACYGYYGLTEASPAVAVLKPWDRPREWGSVGRPFMCTEVRIVDEEDRDLAAGREGEIIVRGPTVFKGYYNNPEETARTLRGGWLHTGDVGRYDDAGYLYMVDRIKDMIKTGGINVYCREVEEALSLHPHIAEAAIIGVPHPKWGESIRAVVVPREGFSLTEAEVIEHCREHLAAHKKPTSVVFVSELPKGSFGGKVLKRLLRERYGRE
ncbi:MAG: long-chain fatty acid--CoA ligase [Desulfobacteraceae bacterium]|nr:MAG: long-chain fatty acid--CoA ligase [Desulfobacteraceae bacterium]